MGLVFWSFENAAFSFFWGGWMMYDVAVFCHDCFFFSCLVCRDLRGVSGRAGPRLPGGLSTSALSSRPAGKSGCKMM